MPLLKRHKYVIAGLSLYWPLLFVATHIPIQNLNFRTGMSDKTMHFLAYLGLVFLLWLAVSPYEKVNWRKAKVWVILAVIVWYGVLDEWIQGHVGRDASVADLLADLKGTLLGLGLLTFMSFWPAALTVTAIFIFVISNMSALDMIWQQPYLNIAFHFIGYATFALIWIQYRDRILNRKASAARWILSAIGGPLALLAVVKVSSLFFGKQIWPIDCIAAAAAIGLATGVSRFVCRTIWIESD